MSSRGGTKPRDHHRRNPATCPSSCLPPKEHDIEGAMSYHIAAEGIADTTGLGLTTQSLSKESSGEERRAVAREVGSGAPRQDISGLEALTASATVRATQGAWMQYGDHVRVAGRTTWDGGVADGEDREG